jgi:sialate O-acetylesterase
MKVARRLDWRRNEKIFNSLIFLTSLAFAARANVHPNSLFSDNALLQRGAEIHVFGTARDGEKIAVEFNGQKVSAMATNGEWKVRLKPMRANSTPQGMIITGDNTITFTNILIGDVWVASGQSNMERQLGPRDPQPKMENWEAEVAGADYPQIREFYVPQRVARTPAIDAHGYWRVCSPKTVKDFSAVGYFFARDVHKAAKVPIGILFTAWGGTVAEAWTSAKSLKTMPDFKTMVENFEQLKVKDGPNTVTMLFNGMIAPLLTFPIKGAIWYQGESNNDRPQQYQQLLPLLISDWRKAWNCGELPFLFVQIAPHRDIKPELREAQLLTLNRVPNTAMAVITDAGDANDIHPARKQVPGQRLALAARALAYHEKLEYSGPLFKSNAVKDNRAFLSFTHTGGGLLAKGGVLSGFTIAGADGKFFPARAEIQGKKVIAWSDEVAMPVSVRYGWANVPDGNLYNKEGLPASPFRTDLLKSN